MTAILTCEHVSRRFPQFSLTDISFSLEKGYLAGMVGRNASGKSALLRILSGQDLHFQGNITIQGISIKENPVKIRNLIGFIFEDQPVFLEKSPLENGICFGRYFEHYDEAYYRKWLDRMGVDYFSPVHKLSKGNRMKFLCCLALSHHPEILLLDEPSAGFDPIFRKEFLTILQELLEEDMTILMTSHITEDLDKVADYILHLENGRLIHKETIEQLRTKNPRAKVSDSFAGTVQIKDLLKTSKEGRTRL